VDSAYRRGMRPLGAVALLAVLAAGCSAGDDGDSSGDGPTPPTSSPSRLLLSETEACAEVRAGIDAFNLGDLEETVRHFERATPLAERLVADGEDARLLLEAIDYYAALPPEASPSPDFQRNKAITLTICEYGAGPQEEPTDDGVPA
jgi:hypothetical protein